MGSWIIKVIRGGKMLVWRGGVMRMRVGSWMIMVEKKWGFFSFS